MPYSATYRNGNELGRVEAGVHRVTLADFEEIAERINRRRMLVYKLAHDFSSVLSSGMWVRTAPLAAGTYPPFDNLRRNLLIDIVPTSPGALGGDPPTPAAMEWLWPVAGDDEDKLIVPGDGEIGEDEVGLLQKLNGTDSWTDGYIQAGVSRIRDVHVNEIRQAIEWLSRGRWRLPIYLPAGIFSAFPDAPWIPHAIANNGSVDLRSVGFAMFTDTDTPPRGLTDVTVRSASSITVTADQNCTVEVRHCLRAIPWETAFPTWNDYDPDAPSAWATPGGTGAGDSTYVGAISLQANTPGTLSNSNVVAAAQAIIDGAHPYFILRRTDTGPLTVNVAAEITVEFDLNADE